MKRILKNVVSLLRRSGKRSMFLTRPALEMLEDRCVPSTFTVTNVNDSGPGSLRQAILDANQHFVSGEPSLLQLLKEHVNVQPDVIQFRIGSGVRRITPRSPLPQVIDEVIIDGTTQPGYAGKPLIVLSGGGAGTGTDGLDFWTPGSGVRGLVINDFARNGVQLGANGEFVQGCYVGTDVTGTLAEGNDTGINVYGTGDTIGGASAAQRNVISGNELGVYVGGDVDLVENNFIGTDAAGKHALGNSADGVLLHSTGSSVLRNVIAANADGVHVQGGRLNVIQSNWIGTNAVGARLGNFDNGVRLDDPYSYQGHGNQIGGVSAGLGNVIAFNGLDGVRVEDDMASNPIRGNSIYGNGHLGINLEHAPGFAPLLWFAQSGKTTVVEGLVAGATPYATYYVDFYASPAGSGSSAQGQRYLGSTALVWNPFSGVPIFVATPGKTMKGEIITATVTDAAGNTTAFSAGLPAA
jgi:hypothetical protein